MVESYLALGSNLGDRSGYLDKAIEKLNAHEEIHVVAVSSYHETVPVGYLDQGDFINAVIRVDTSLGAFELLDYCLSVELLLGRERTFKNGPRTIDIDLLIYGDFKLNTDRLVLPHPRMLEREFVMKPLMEVLNGAYVVCR